MTQKEAAKSMVKALSKTNAQFVCVMRSTMLKALGVDDPFAPEEPIPSPIEPPLEEPSEGDTE